MRQGVAYFLQNWNQIQASLRQWESVLIPEVTKNPPMTTTAC